MFCFKLSVLAKKLTKLTWETRKVFSSFKGLRNNLQYNSKQLTKVTTQKFHGPKIKSSFFISSRCSEAQFLLNQNTFDVEEETETEKNIKTKHWNPLITNQKHEQGSKLDTKLQQTKRKVVRKFVYLRRGYTSLLVFKKAVSFTVGGKCWNGSLFSRRDCSNSVCESQRFP